MLHKEKYTKLSESELDSCIERPVTVGKLIEGTAKNGKSFLTVTILDGYSSIDAKYFDMCLNELELQGVYEGMVVDLKASVKDYKGSKSFNIASMVPNTDPLLSPNDFVRAVPYRTEDLYQSIFSELYKVYNDHITELHPNGPDCTYEPIIKLALQLLTEHKEEFIFSSAAKTVHHNLIGGLVYHTARMVCDAKHISYIYPMLNQELLLCGAALHDIGKLKELSTSASGDTVYTLDGTLMGHLYMGAEMIHDESKKRNYNPEEVRLLKHMILSHHGKQEYGAVMPPATPEAIVLNYIDGIDAKIYQFEEIYEDLEKGTCTERRPFGLDNNVYRPML